MEFKDNEQIQSMCEKLSRKLEARGFSIGEDDIFDEIESAVEVVNERRRFQPTASALFDTKYTNLIMRLCIASISKWGAEGESSHSENNIVRRYEKGSEYPESMLSEIIPLGKAAK